MPVTLGRVGGHIRLDGSILTFNSFGGLLITFDVATKVQKFLKKNSFLIPHNDASLSFAEIMQAIHVGTFINEANLFLAHGLSHPENNGANISKLICVGNCNPTDFDILNKTL